MKYYSPQLHNKGENHMIISVDAEQIFDNTQYSFISITLSQLGKRPSLVWWNKYIFLKNPQQTSHLIVKFWMFLP